VSAANPSFMARSVRLAPPPASIHPALQAELAAQCDLAEAFHHNFEVHHGGDSLNNVANLHVITTIRNTEFFEVLLPAASQKYGLARDIEIDAAGLVHAPAGPGLGTEIDFALVERKKVAVLA